MIMMKDGDVSRNGLLYMLKALVENQTEKLRNVLERIIKLSIL